MMLSYTFHWVNVAYRILGKRSGNMVYLLLLYVIVRLIYLHV